MTSKQGRGGSRERPERLAEEGERDRGSYHRAKEFAGQEESILFVS